MTSPAGGRALSRAVAVERWPLKSPFVIARGAKTDAEVVVVSLSDGAVTGRGECVPYARYGETVDGVVAALEGARPVADRIELRAAMPPGAARNALDCALWDLDAKRARRRAAALAGLGELSPVETCYTLSLAPPEAMAAAARAVPHLRLLKLKLGGTGDAERMAAVRQVRPDARLVADANESWTDEALPSLLGAARAAAIELIEQPLPAGDDAVLGSLAHIVPVCADESAHVTADIAPLARRYDAVNIKLDKAGGLSEALAMAAEARARGLRIMAGSMVATSLAVAPALILAQQADWVDLDGPLLLARDRAHGLIVENGWILPPSPDLWG